MSVSIQTNVTIPNLTPSELEERTKNNPYVDGYQHYQVGKIAGDKGNKKQYNPYVDDPVKESPEGVWSKTNKIKLPRFFNSILEKRVNGVAMMVLFHIIHFFCQKFWKNYRVRFEGKLAFKDELGKKTKKFKVEQLLLGAKVDKLKKKIEAQKKEAEKNSTQWNGVSFIDTLPKDVISIILGHLPPKDRHNFGSTCKSAYQLVKNYESFTHSKSK